MFDFRQMRPVIAIPIQSIATCIVCLLIAAFAAYVIIGGVSIFATIFAIALSPMLIFIPLGFFFGWGLVNRPLITGACLIAFLAVIAIVAWNVGLNDQLQHAAIQRSTFNVATRPLLLISLTLFLTWLALVVALHLWKRPRLAPWPLITIAAIGIFVLWMKFTIGYWHTLYLGSDLRRYDDHMAVVKQNVIRRCDKAQFTIDLSPHDAQLCQDYGDLPPIDGRPWPVRK